MKTGTHPAPQDSFQLWPDALDQKQGPRDIWCHHQGVTLLREDVDSNHLVETLKGDVNLFCTSKLVKWDLTVVISFFFTNKGTKLAKYTYKEDAEIKCYKMR